MSPDRPSIPRSRWLAGFLGLCSLALAFPNGARADTVVLKNGREYHGKILSRDAASIVIQSDGVEWTLRREDVQSAGKDRTGATGGTGRRDGAWYQRRVAIYRGKGCAECDGWTAIFRKHRTPYEEFDIENRKTYLAFDDKCRRMRFTVASYPIIEVDGALMGRGTPGFDQKLARILGRR